LLVVVEVKGVLFTVFVWLAFIATVFAAGFITCGSQPTVITTDSERPLR